MTNLVVQVIRNNLEAVEMEHMTNVRYLMNCKPFHAAYLIARKYLDIGLMMDLARLLKLQYLVELGD